MKYSFLKLKEHSWNLTKSDPFSYCSTYFTRVKLLTWKSYVKDGGKGIFRMHSLLWISEINQNHRVFYKKGVLKIFANFTGKHLHWSLIR